MKTKALISVILVIMVLFTITSMSIAAPATKINPDSYKPQNVSSAELDVPMSKTKTILTAITSIGLVVAVIMVMVLGIRYMIGSVEQRAEYKKTMIPFIIGAFLLFSVSFVVRMLYTVTQAINS